MKAYLILFKVGLALLLVALVSATAIQAGAQDDQAMEALGKALFFDKNLSVNGSQSCADCHAAEVGTTGPDSMINAHGAVYQGALEDRFGNRKPPASAYTGDSPVLHFSETAMEWVGGMFWDGRATGWTLGDPLAEQAGGPYLNPLEQAMPGEKQVCLRVKTSGYVDLFYQAWGPDSLDCVKDVAGTYERISRAVAAYERSAEVNPFTSKFDLFWDNATAAGKDVTKIKFSGGMGGPGGGGGGMGGPGGGGGGGGGGGMDPNRWQNFRGLGLTDIELQGLAAFNDPNRGDCASCHSLEPGADGYPLFTNFGYDNLGIPKNLENPYYNMPQKWNPDGTVWVDEGLGGFLKSAGYAPEVYEPEIGKFKVPSLRNVDLRPSEDFVKAYGHNGYFKSLEEVIMFYAWRGMMDMGCMEEGCMGGGMGPGGGMGGGGMGGGMMNPDMFPEPEVSANLAPLKMFPMMDHQTILAFMKTLSDGYFER